MIAVMLVFCALGLVGGTLLIRRVPLCPTHKAASPLSLSIVIPARNEEHNLPRLLESIESTQFVAPSVIVVDDASTDKSAAIAASRGATVVTAPPVPAGWTGKTWACAHGAKAAHSDMWLFLDADTWFDPQGLDRILSAWQQFPGQPVALSLLPFHIIRKPYERLSLFFNLLMAFGAGGFGGVGKPRLFGQRLLISRDMYEACGGHAAVRGRILENFAMADRVEAVDGRCVYLGGRGVINVRMFPDGLSQLCESWRKAFADGAAASDSTVLALAIVWLAALCAIFLLLSFAPWPLRGFAAILYALAAAQVYWSACRLGAFGWTTALLYPIPLLFFFGLFTSSLLDRILRRQVTWRGRRL